MQIPQTSLRDALGRLIAAAIDALDQLDGDPDREDGADAEDWPEL